MRDVTIEEKVSFLRRPESYPETTARVEVRETHRSWVFLTRAWAYKMKKPVRTAFADYSTLGARHLTCEAEVRLNQPLARDVYCGVVPLTVSDDDELRLGGAGAVVEWLVRMRRLPDARMLDRALAQRWYTAEDARRVGESLVAFYRATPAAALTVHDYRCGLETEIGSNRAELARPEYSLPRNTLDALTTAQLGFLDREELALEQRVRAGRIVEAHGDLRPEHICLEHPPVIIDRLEFSRALRTLDAASELAFLWLECERLGAADFGEAVFATYCRETGDHPPPALMAFYKAWHACVRAKIAVWHVHDHGINDKSRWLGRARRYLEFAASCHLACGGNATKERKYSS
ncbi:MAG TPA: hypothetical protein VGD81_07085 [Opitutaceae bacterium]